MGGITVPMALVLMWMPLGVADRLAQINVLDWVAWVPVCLPFLALWLLQSVGGAFNVKHRPVLRQAVVLVVLALTGTLVAWLGGSELRLFFAVLACGLWSGVVGIWLASRSVTFLGVAYTLIAGWGFISPTSVQRHISLVVLVALVTLFTAWVEASAKAKKKQ